MHRITRRMWDRGLTQKRWALLNGFSERYVQLIVGGARGSWNAGTGKKIKLALINQGLATAEELSYDESEQ